MHDRIGSNDPNNVKVYEGFTSALRNALDTVDLSAHWPATIVYRDLKVRIPPKTTPPASDDERNTQRGLLSHYQTVELIEQGPRMLRLTQLGGDSVDLYLNDRSTATRAHVRTTRMSRSFDFVTGVWQCDDRAQITCIQRADGLRHESTTRPGTGAHAINAVAQAALVNPSGLAAGDLAAVQDKLTELTDTPLERHSFSADSANAAAERQVLRERIEECGFALAVQGDDFGSLVVVAAQNGVERHAVMLGPKGRDLTYASVEEALNDAATLDLICAQAGYTLPPVCDAPIGAYVRGEGFKFAGNLTDDDILAQPPEAHEVLRQARRAAQEKGANTIRRAETLTTQLNVPQSITEWTSALASDHALLGLTSENRECALTLVAWLGDEARGGVPRSDLLDIGSTKAATTEALRMLVWCLKKRSVLDVPNTTDLRTATRKRLVGLLQAKDRLPLLPQELLLISDRLTYRTLENAAGSHSPGKVAPASRRHDAFRMGAFLTAVRQQQHKTLPDIGHTYTGGTAAGRTNKKATGVAHPYNRLRERNQRNRT